MLVFFISLFYLISILQPEKEGSRWEGVSHFAVVLLYVV